MSRCLAATIHAPTEQIHGISAAVHHVPNGRALLLSVHRAQDVEVAVIGRELDGCRLRAHPGP